MKKLPRSISCHECGDLQIKYKTASGKRHRYFCSEEHALQFVARKLNRKLGGKYGVYTPEGLKNNGSVHLRGVQYGVFK